MVAKSWRFISAGHIAWTQELIQNSGGDTSWTVTSCNNMTTLKYAVDKSGEVSRFYTKLKGSSYFSCSFISAEQKVGTGFPVRD
jgi:hypothetical protein